MYTHMLLQHHTHLTFRSYLSGTDQQSLLQSTVLQARFFRLTFVKHRSSIIPTCVPFSTDNNASLLLGRSGSYDIPALRHLLPHRLPGYFDLFWTSSHQLSRAFSACGVPGASGERQPNQDLRRPPWLHFSVPRREWYLRTARR